MTTTNERILRNSRDPQPAEPQQGTRIPEKINNARRRESMSPEEKAAKKRQRDRQLARSKRQGKGSSQINSHVTTDIADDAYGSPISWEEKPWWRWNNNARAQLNPKQLDKVCGLYEERFGPYFQKKRKSRVIRPTNS